MKINKRMKKERMQRRHRLNTVWNGLHPWVQIHKDDQPEQASRSISSSHYAASWTCHLMISSKVMQQSRIMHAEEAACQVYGGYDLAKVSDWDSANARVNLRDLDETNWQTSTLLTRSSQKLWAIIRKLWGSKTVECVVFSVPVGKLSDPQGNTALSQRYTTYISVTASYLITSIHG